VRVETVTKTVEASLQVPNHQLWSPEDPALYRVTASIQVAKSPSIDQQSVRCGFRDLRFENGYFQLNGRRIFLKGMYHAMHFPITYVIPHDPELMRRDVSNLKKAGCNMIRIAFRSMPQMLELCDEAGILVYQEHYGSWQLRDSPAMKSRWNASISEVILRDRNHPSLVMW
jgi:beta-galactosidase/beta-glucuronidase